MKYLFLDTNVYIHYNDFEQIDWKELFNDDVSIVIPPIIMREIDSLKDRDNNARRKVKAKKIASKISDYLLYEKKGKFSVLTCKGPHPTLYDMYSYDRAVNDDVFLLSVLQFKEEQGFEVCVVAADNPALVKAKELGLPFYQMGDEFKLKEEQTEEQKEIKELKATLAKYENRKPCPRLLFKDQTSLLKIKRPNTFLLQEEILTRLKEMRNDVPYKEYVPNNEKYTNLISMSTFMSEEKVRNYNNEVDLYYAEYEKYIQKTLCYDFLNSCMYKLEFLVGNGEGTSPTGNLYIELTFPDNISLYSNKNWKHISEEIPIKPNYSSFYQIGQSSREFEKLLAIASNKGRFPHSEHKVWNLKTKADNFYKIQETTISQRLCRMLDMSDLYINLKEVDNFQINYMIIDTELIEPVNGVINLLVED